MTKLIVELDDFVDAARAMRHEVAENVELCLSAVAGRLQPELVGVDPAGVAWAADYDPAVRSVLAASALLANGAYKTSQLFAASGRNYALAEHASTTGGGAALPVAEWTQLLADQPSVRAPAVPSAGGAGHDTPADWWLVEHTIGVLWPGGHQDRLRATADAWRSAARGLDHALGVPLSVTARFVLDNLPEADNIRTTCQGLYDRLTALTGGYRSLAESCDEYATHLDSCHQAVEDELATLARDSIITQGVGAALSVISFGLAQVPTQAAQAARIAVSANRIRQLIERLIAAAKLVGAAVARVGRLADDIHHAMQGLATTRIAYAGITNVPRLRRIERAESVAKDGKTVTNAGKAAGHVPTAAARSSRPFKMAKDDRDHILDGTRGGGGHRWPGADGKTPFPKGWSDDQIIEHVEDIVSSPSTVWRAQNGSGGVYMKSGQPATWRAWEIRNGVRIRVAFEPATGRIHTAFPDAEAASGLVVP